MVAVTVRPETDRGKQPRRRCSGPEIQTRQTPTNNTVPLHYAGAGAGGAADPDRGVSRAPHGTRLP